jgi:hypothetical protein
VGNIEKDATSRNQMNFLIVGDSWGCGEWDKDCNTNPHRGLEQYLIEDGHTVVNLSNQGISNHDIYQRIEHYFKRNLEHTIDSIFVFQTEYNRDYKHSSGWENELHAGDWTAISEPEDLSMRWISRFYKNLSKVSQQTGCNVFIIGGHSDTLWFDNMSEHYPGCEVVCQSMTNLILFGNHRVDQPVLSFYEQRTEQLVKEIKTKLDSPEKLERLLDLIDQGYQREMLLRENPEYFYPDGIHPNRQGIQILYNFLKGKYFQ